MDNKSSAGISYVNQGPLVSIVLPTYNRQKYIGGAIESCLKQSYKNIELIVVDDGSTDRTADVVRSYSDPRVRYFRQSSNSGLPRALNRGFNETRGEYFTWIADDNFFEINAIEKMLSILLLQKVEFVFANMYIFLNDDFDAKTLHLTKFDLKLGNHVGACFLYSKKIKDDIGEYDDETKLAEDYDYWIRISKKYSMFHIDGSPLYYYRRHPQSLYESNYFLVHILLCLISFRWKISNRQETKDALIKLFMKKRKISGPFAFRLVNIFLGKRIKKILLNFETGYSTLNVSKENLQQILI